MSRIVSLLVLGAAAAAGAAFIPASDPHIEYVGRTLINADGSRSFDWEATQVILNVANASSVAAVIHATGGAVGRVVAEVDSWEVNSFWIGGDSGAVNNDTFVFAFNLVGSHHVRLVSVLEPAFEGAAVGQFFTFAGFVTDGVPLAPLPRTRNIELIGDSISAGYGARGFAGAPWGCPVDDDTSGEGARRGCTAADFMPRLAFRELLHVQLDAG